MQASERMNIIPKTSVCDDTVVADEIYRLFEVSLWKILSWELNKIVTNPQWNLDPDKLLLLVESFVKVLEFKKNIYEEIEALKDIWVTFPVRDDNDIFEKQKIVHKLVVDVMRKYSLQNQTTLSETMSEFESQYKTKLLISWKSIMEYSLKNFLKEFSERTEW